MAKRTGKGTTRNQKASPRARRPAAKRGKSLKPKKQAQNRVGRQLHTPKQTIALPKLARESVAIPTPVGRRRPAHRTITPPPRPAPNLRHTSSPSTIYDQNLERLTANFQPLTPLTFLRRAARAFPETIAIIHGRRRFSYHEFYARSRRLASALARMGLGRGDTVSALLSNTPAMLEAHHGVPMAGCVLNALNTRLDAASITFMLDHSEAKLVIADREFADCAIAALKLAQNKPPLVIYDDPEFPQRGEVGAAIDYEGILSAGDPEFEWAIPDDEWDAISLNYTSGTTGDPKGVVCHHRGAALMGYANTIACQMQARPVYLWTLPMFHCNGWCFPWTLALTAGTHICLRWVRAGEIYAAIAEHRVTHLCGAPTVMSMLLNARPSEKRAFAHRVNFVHAAAPPPEAMLMSMLQAGFDLTHVYGLTETYGPATVNDWHPEWHDLPGPEQGPKRIRQGVPYPALEEQIGRAHV